MSKENLRADSLTPAERAAVLLLSLGKDTASEVMKRLSPEETARIVRSMPSVSNTPVEVHKEINQEFSKLAKASEKLLIDGKAFAKEILQSVFGSNESLDNSNPTEEIKSLLLSVPDSVIRDFFSTEHLQTAAFLLAVMDPAQAARVVGGMDPVKQYDIMMRVAFLKPVNSNLISEVKEIIREQLVSESKLELNNVDGKKAAASIINAMGSTRSEKILEDIAEVEPELRNELEQLVFTFDDFIKIPEKSLQAIIQETPRDKLAIALKTSNKDLTHKILNNVSSRMRVFLEEELESMSPKRKVDVEKAQSDIIDTARRLEAEGRISLSAEDSDEWV